MPDFPIKNKIDSRAAAIAQQVTQWRRVFHEHPELSNREFETTKVVADHLRSLGLEIKIGIAHTGVIALLRGGKPGSVVALRADMDALPVTEAVAIPFASKIRAQHNGEEVGVMHACGHDAHTAILMGVATLLSEMRQEIPGTVKFIFQPAEEGAPEGEEGGAKVMVREGVLKEPHPNAIFALHVHGLAEAGTVLYRPGGIMASNDGLQIIVKGEGTHGAMPWYGKDPIVMSAQIIFGLQTIVSRQINLTVAPAVVTIGSIHGGNKENVTPDDVEMRGTIRVLDPKIREEVRQRVKTTAENIAKGGGMEAVVTIHPGDSVLYNDPQLTTKMLPTLQRVVGNDKVGITPPVTASEDFSQYLESTPGFYFFLGVRPKTTPPEKAAMNHSPKFFLDETALVVGVRLLTHMTVDYLTQQ